MSGSMTSSARNEASVAEDAAAIAMVHREFERQTGSVQSEKEFSGDCPAGTLTRRPWRDLPR